MKKDKIEELFKSNCDLYRSGRELMKIGQFAKTINQAELEWYKKLEKKLNNIAQSMSTINAFYEYKLEIENKIMELEDGN